MTNNELSEIEIKLMNASRNFAEEQNKKEGFTKYWIETIDNPKEETIFIGVMFTYSRNVLDHDFYHGLTTREKCSSEALVFANYKPKENDISEQLYIGRMKNDEDIINFQNIYKNFLIKEIPEIQDRIK